MDSFRPPIEGRRNSEFAIYTPRRGGRTGEVTREGAEEGEWGSQTAMKPSPARAPVIPSELRLSRLLRFLARGVRLRCPNCGAGQLFSRWLWMRSICPGCHLKLDRGEPDYFLGSYVVNFVAAELGIALAALSVIWSTWPEVPWRGLYWGLMLGVLPVPVLFYPFAKTLWLAIDLCFRPATPADLAGHGENLPGSPWKRP